MSMKKIAGIKFTAPAVNGATVRSESELRGDNFVLRNYNPLKRQASSAIRAEAMKRRQDDEARRKAEQAEANRRNNVLNGALEGEIFSTGRKIRRASDLFKRNAGNTLPALRIANYFDIPKDLNEKQKRYAKNTVTMGDLTRPTSKKTKSYNPLNLSRYIFMSELKVCMPGFLYNTVPMIISLVLIILNFNADNFIYNLTCAVFALIAFLESATIIKSNSNTIVKILAAPLPIALFVATVALTERFYPETFAKIDINFSIRLFVITFSIYHFGKFYALFAIMYKQDLQADFGNVVKCKYGPPGVGKTSQGVHEIFILALLKWRDLQMDYFLWHSREKEILARNDPDELLDYYEIKQSYSFYIMHTCIPCLWSNLIITDSAGRRCHELELDHLRGLKRLPAYSVVMLDEIGTALGNEVSKDKKNNLDIADMFRLGRQFLKWSVICCEQDPSNMFIECRRVMGANEGIKGQTWHCKPVLLIALRNMLTFFLTDMFDRSIPYMPAFAKFLSRFDKLISSIGFRIQRTEIMGNTQTAMKGDSADVNGAVVAGRRFRVVPARIVANYDDREFRRQYPSRYDKQINGRLAGEGVLSERVTGYGRQYVSETATLTEKREAQESKIKNIA